MKFPYKYNRLFLMIFPKVVETQTGNTRTQTFHLFNFSCITDLKKCTSTKNKQIRGVESNKLPAGLPVLFCKVSQFSESCQKRFRSFLSFQKRWWAASANSKMSSETQTKSIFSGCHYLLFIRYVPLFGSENVWS